MVRRLRIAVVGLGFGKPFVPIYAVHPNVEYVGICDLNTELAALVAKENAVTRCHTNLEEVIGSKEYDAIHLLTPVTTHGSLVLKIMQSGKHCASAVPMGLSLEELQRIVELQEKTRLNYMMMETQIYTSHYLYAKELHKKSVLGKIQFMRGCHSQDLEAINPVWRGLPPMWYMTHAVSPLLDILDTQATEVHCYGSGTMREEFKENYGNPYPIETAIFKLKNTAAKAEITRTLFETAPYGDEAFDLYGEHATFATIGRKPQLIAISPLTRTGERRTIRNQDPEIPFRPDLLPEALQKFASGGHGGSHPHLAHEFIRSIVEERQPYIHARRAANWTAPGICAHASAMKDGGKVMIPNF